MTKKILSILFVLASILALIDCVKNPDTILRLTTISSGGIITIFFLLLLTLRICGKIVLGEKIIRFSFFCGSFLLLLATILALANVGHNANYIYSHTYINMDKLFMLGLFITGSGAISLSNKFFRKNYKLLLCASSLFFLAALYVYGLLPFSALEEITHEDQFIETMQFVVLVIGGAYSFLIAAKIFNKQKLFAILFLLLGLGLLFTAGDEISWGQRIFNLETITVSKSNMQNELTVHNERGVSWVVPILYMGIGLYGAFAWIPYFFVKKRAKKLAIFIPGTYLFFFFFSGFLYNAVARLNLPRIGIYSEPAELLLYSGAMFYLLITYKIINR